MGSAVLGAGPRKNSPSLVTTETVPLSDLRNLASKRQLYAILDACDAPGVPQKARELGEENAVSLYRGEAEEDFWAIAPYLISVDSSVLDWIASTLWEQPWGIFVVAEVNFETLRTHFRKFLTVSLPDGEKVYFRFYDPRVIQQFLPTCNQAELAEFFGSVQKFGCGLAGQEGVVFFRM
jgi:hypothetical protein